MKPRSDSILKIRAEANEEFGEKIWEWLLTPKSEDCVGGAKYAREQLAADGINVSEQLLSDFYSWWGLRRGFKQLNSRVQDFEELLRQDAVSPERIQEYGQAAFTMQAAATEDAKKYVELEKLRLKKEAGALKKKEFELLKQKFELEAAERMLSEALRRRAEEIASSSLSNSEKIKAMREAAFADVDALQASGEIKLPE